jgi:hypothetical protein
LKTTGIISAKFTDMTQTKLINSGYRLIVSKLKYTLKLYLLLSSSIRNQIKIIRISCFYTDSSSAILVYGKIAKQPRWNDKVNRKVEYQLD